MTPQTSPRRSRIAHFKAPFIVSLAASAALGCGGKADVVDEGVRNVPLAENQLGADAGAGCPGAFPSSGSACQLDATELCSYFHPDCPSTARCVDGSWSTSLLACNPPPPELQSCPEVEPEAGTSCWGSAAGLTCEYPFCYDTAPTVRCGADGAWEAHSLPSCNPPPVERCPEAMPEPGSDCVSEELFCGYPGCEGSESSTAACRHGQWWVEYSSGPACNPPAVVPVCPGVEPTSDGGCAYDGQVCSYGTCGDLSDARRTHTCASGTWQTFEPGCAPAAGEVDAGAAGVDAGGGSSG